MKIIHVVTLISQDGAFGGPLRVALNQVRELRRRGHEVELLAGWRGDRPPLHVDGITVRAFPARQLIPGAGFSGLYSSGLYRWLRSAVERADILHVHAGRDLTSLSALAAAQGSRCTTVVQTHGMIDADSRIRARILDRLMVRRLIGGASIVFALTDYEEAVLPRVVGKGMYSLIRLPNGVPSHGLTQAREGSNVLYCARLHQRKRPNAFVDMAALVSTPSVTFSIVGPDEGQLRSVLSRIDELDLGDRARYEGPLPYDQVLQRMALTDIYVLPSVREPFPMTLLEAMSLGLPCVCTDTCGISDELRQAGAAAITDGSPMSMAAAVDQIFSDASYRTSLARAAQHLINTKYSISVVVDSLEAAYKSALYDSPVPDAQ